MKQVKEMNQRLDQIFRDGVDVRTTQEAVREQIEFLIDVLNAEKQHLTRLDFDEHGIIYGMIRVLRESLYEATQ